MSKDGWEHLRNGITDSHNRKAGMTARCLACHGEVYIRTAKGRSLYAHYSGSNPNSP